MSEALEAIAQGFLAAAPFGQVGVDSASSGHGAVKGRTAERNGNMERLL